MHTPDRGEAVTDGGRTSRTDGALRASEELYRSVVTAMAEGVVLQAANGEITAVNPAAERIHGRSAAQMIGQTFDDPEWGAVHEDSSLFPGDEHPSMIALRTGEPQSNVRMGIRRPDGTRVWISMNSQPLVSEGGTAPYAVVTTFHDISAEKKAEDERLANVGFVESLDRVNRAIQGTEDLEEMMRNVLDALLSVFQCDRAWLGFPCDPDAPSWRVPMVRARPECPIVLLPGDEVPMSEGYKMVLQRLNASNGPVIFGPGADHPVPIGGLQRFGVLSMICMRIQPKANPPWTFGLHQCSHARTWTSQDGILFQEVGRRLADGLTSLLTLRKEREANAKVVEISESITDMFSVYDRNWRIVQINKRAAQAAGMSREEMLGRRLWDLFPERVGQTSYHNLVQVMESRIPKIYEVNVASIDHWLECHAYPTAEGVAVYARDITDRKRAEEGLRWKTAFFEAQVDSALDGILVVDNLGKKILQNQRMNDLWGFPPHILSSNNDAEQLEYATSQAKNPKQFFDKVAYLYAHPNEISQDEIELVTGRVLERYSSPVRDAAGNHYGRIWTFRDVTERRRLEEQFRQSQKMEAIGQLAGGIAHDFNNFLAVVEMQSSMLLNYPASVQETKDGLRLIITACERAANLTRQLLTFSRRSVRDAKDIDLSGVTASMTKFLQRLLGEGVVLETRIASSTPLVNADSGMIEQVLMNLVLNARDSMPSGGSLTVSLEAVVIDSEYVAARPQSRLGRFVCLSVSDTGCGIPRENLPRIFEPFFTTKENGKGTGLGLATVFGIVELHEGWIDVASEIDRGTTFKIFLPASATLPAATTSQGGSQATAALGGNETILLVEDETAVRKLAGLVLERQGYRVFQAGSGTEALELWTTLTVPVDLLLTDLVMPGGMSGYELSERLCALRPTLKVIYVSGYSNDFIKHRLLLQPGRNFLHKPWSNSALAAMVRRRLDEK